MSLQDFINLKLQLMTSKPDLVIVFNGYNNHSISWDSRLEAYNLLLYVPVGSNVLHTLWDDHANKKILNLFNLRSKIEYYF